MNDGPKKQRGITQIGRTLRSLWGLGRAGTEYVNGQHPIDIPRLISPLRFDVLVRKGFFELLAAEEPLYHKDFDRFMDLAIGSDYHAWFTKVYCARFHPELLKTPSGALAAFRARVRASAQLYLNFRADGFSGSHRITLRSGRKVLPSDSGKQVSAQIFVGDGCHRLALLLMSGATRLEPAHYRVKVKPRYTPLDNTLLLLPAIGLTERPYAAFVSRAFEDIEHGSLEGLEKSVAANAPHRIEELRGILSRDIPFLKPETVTPPGEAR